MATDRCRIDQMAHVIMEGLQEYADLATEDYKSQGVLTDWRKCDEHD